MAVTYGFADSGGSQSLRGSNQSGMRAYNERLVLSLVRRHGTMVKTELARLTGLSAQTISVIMRSLESEVLLVRGEPIRGKVGQPSVPLSINPKGAFFFGLKVGRRSADLVLLDFLGDVVARDHLAYPYPQPGAIIEFSRQGIARMTDNLDAVERRRIAGLGVAMPFQIWNWREEVGAPNDTMDQWQQVDLKAEIAALCPFPIYLQNDATAACAAELIFGPQSGSARQNFVYFYIGTFVGGGIVLNGSLYSGPSGNAGAMGSMPVLGPDGRSQRLIDQASLIVLERMLSAEGIDPAPLSRSPDDWSGLEGHAERWIETVASALAYAIVASISVIDFEAVVIDGGMPAALRDQLVEKTRLAMAKHDLQGLAVPAIEAGTMGPIARAKGAASLPLFDKYLVDQHTLMREA